MPGCQVSVRHLIRLVYVNLNPIPVIWVPDPNLLNVEYLGAEKPDQVLGSIEEFVPEDWGLPPYASSSH